MASVKKFCFIILILVFFSLICQKEAGAAFGIAISGPEGTLINFGTVSPPISQETIVSEIPTEGLTVTCTTGETDTWVLEIWTDGVPLTHELNPAAQIPDTNFYWYVENTTGSTARLVYPLQQREDFTVRKTIYNGLATEGASGIDFVMKFELVIPANMQSGTYNMSNNIFLTLTE
jgi:hypothetical protein